MLTGFRRILMNILIVESKAKCKTIQKHLGSKEWRVLSTGGHVQDLPSDRSRHDPKQVKKAYWASRTGELPNPPWEWSERGKKAVDAIREEAAKHTSVVFYLASDPDREGERIAWHLDKLLSGDGPCHRVTFQEVTKQAILAAVEAPRGLDRSLVDAALVRVFLDRLVGWRTRGIAQKHCKGKGAMGRVQTPTLGFIVQRELDREAHVPIAFFEVRAASPLTDRWKVRFHEKDDPRAWRDDKLQFDAHRTGDGDQAERAHALVAAAGMLKVDRLDRSERTQRPKAAFRTDTLIRAAGSKFGWSPRNTARLASQLYSAGLITYIRTDSTRLSGEAVDRGRAVIEATWGEVMLGAVPAAETPVAGVQDAHEAIRPTDLALKEVEEADDDAQKLYRLVWARTLAALMAPAVRVSLSLSARVEGLDLPLEGSVGWYAQPGWRHAFESVNPPLETAPRLVEIGQIEVLTSATSDSPNPELREDETKPPPRYKAPKVIELMRKYGIGRPSTYAKTVEKLIESRYLEETDGELVPTDGGRAIWLRAAPCYAVGAGESVFDVDYTANMESLLDRIAEGLVPAGPKWLELRDAFRAAHEHAKEAQSQGAVTQNTRRGIEGYIEAAPDVALEIGDLDKLTEAQGKEWIKKLKGMGVVPNPTQAQLDYLERLLTGTDMTTEDAASAAGITPSTSISGADCSIIIQYLKQNVPSDRPPTEKQLRFIASLAKKKGINEATACALVECASFDELTGGRSGTASRLITILKTR
jgi:DNA topoisomerase-1